MEPLSPEALLQALAHPLRLKILRLLEGDEKIVTTLKDRLEVSQTSVSKHLRVLREAQLVCCEAEGRCRCYGLRHPEQTLALLDELDRLHRSIHEPPPQLHSEDELSRRP